MHVEELEEELPPLLDDELMHYGILRKSGRYPWGSGNNPSQRNKAFLDYVTALKKKGFSETDICKALDIGYDSTTGKTTTTQLRAAMAIAKNEQKAADISTAERLKKTGMSNIAIGERMDLNESSVRQLLNPATKLKNAELIATANMLRDAVKEKGMVDVGAGVEFHIGVPRQKLDTAIAMLREEDYNLYHFPIDTVLGNKTNMKVLASPDTPYSDVYQKRDQITQIANHTEDKGLTYKGVYEPMPISSDRVGIRYAEQGGDTADGAIYVRPGVSDVSLGSGHYAQVRVSVDGTHFIKGMAVYKDDLPKGIDLQFNTNKSDTGNKLDALKPMLIDRETGQVDKLNPFGSIARPIWEAGPDGKDRIKSVMNIVNEEGDWDEWSKNLAPQMLAKQKPTFAREQLDITYQAKKDEYEGIMKLTNPAVREKLLQSFSDDVDSASVHLKAAALPRQKTHVILPINSLKDNEVYAPGYNNGERVVLIRYPHGGIFEIPELVVNNKNSEGRDTIGKAIAAIGINSKVAGQLSGADFDGDTVLVIPNDSRKIKTSPPLEGLKTFNPQASYPKYEGMKIMSNTQQEMGNISNLVTDMTIKDATHSEIARAVRHTMVVIDAEKHKLNYKQSAIDNRIPELKLKYQGGTNKGASTLISRASSELRVDQQTPRKARDGGPIDKATGKLVYEPTGSGYIKVSKTGIETWVPSTTKTTKGKDAADLHKLTSAYDSKGKRVSSGTQIEAIYADHGNRLKALANQARKSMVETQPTPYSPSARTAYANEVASLKAALNIAKKNAPLERQAQIVAKTIVKAKKDANPDMTKAEEKKFNSVALAEARARMNAGKVRVPISPKEWEAIQAGAVSHHFLKEVLANTDLDRVKTYAMPRKATVMVPAKVARAKALLALNYTPAEVARKLGVPVSTLTGALK